jgi:hypothetical protein
MIAVRATLALAEGGKKSRTASIGAGAACRNEPITEAALQIAEHGFVPSRCHDGAPIASAVATVALPKLPERRSRAESRPP